MKEYQSGRLIFGRIDPETEKETTIAFNDLAESASPSDVLAVKEAIQALVDETIDFTTAVVTYQFA